MSAVTNSSTIHEVRELSALLGHPAPCIWATELTGYRAVIWATYDDGMQFATMEKTFDTRKQAETWAKRELSYRQ
jgi:hypothetical protein